MYPADCLLVEILNSIHLNHQHITMKSLSILLIALITSTSVFSQVKPKKTDTPDPTKPIQTVEVSCGECQFKLKGKSCDLAVRIDGKAYFVDGTDIDDHGDAHGKEGFCNAIRKAEVQGKVEKGRYVVTYFKLLPEKS